MFSILTQQQLKLVSQYNIQMNFDYVNGGFLVQTDSGWFFPSSEYIFHLFEPVVWCTVAPYDTPCYPLVIHPAG